MEARDRRKGAKIIERSSVDLKEEFPDMSSFSTRNLKYMRKLAEKRIDPAIMQQVVAQSQWSSIIILLTKIKENHGREMVCAKSGKRT